MAIISQKAVKHDFIGPLGKNQRKNLRSFTTFMQNKANFQKSQMNVSIFSKKAYENKSNWTLGENKPNSNPIKANLKRAKMDVNSYEYADYENKSSRRRQKNKANLREGPNKCKFTYNKGLQKKR